MDIQETLEQLIPRADEDTLAALIDMAEALSAHVCELCGKPGQLSEGDVLRTRCTEHR